MKVGLLFPGQGVQSVGMGRDLVERFPEAASVFERVDEALGMALSTLMWNGPDEELLLTHNAQPAILTHSLAVYATVAAVLSPVVGLGHSLGEYSTFVAAGSLSIEDAARLVRRRGELMHAAGQARPGTMCAVIGLEIEDIERICSDASSGTDVVVPANINAPNQIVLSGDPSAVERAAKLCKDAGAKRVLPLKVSGAFHSPLMEPAKHEFQQELQQIQVEPPIFPVVSSCAATQVNDSATAKALMADQLASPVQWVACMTVASQLVAPNTLFLELGPGKVLGGLAKRIVPNVTCGHMGTADEVEEFLESLACTST